MTENEAIKILKGAYSLLLQCRVRFENVRDYREASEEAIKALKEIQMYRDGNLNLVPSDVFKRQCEELDAYKEIGTVEEVREAVDKTKAKKIVQKEFHDVYFCECPVCNNPVHERDCYCSECGQRLESEE